MNLRTLRRARLALMARREWAYLCDDFDGCVPNPAMYRRLAEKNHRRWERAERRTPMRFEPLGVTMRRPADVTYDNRTGKPTRPPAWARRLDDPRTWPRELRLEPRWSEADIAEFRRYWNAMNSRVMDAVVIPADAVGEWAPRHS